MKYQILDLTLVKGKPMEIPKVIIRCSAFNCVFNVSIDSDTYCTGTPWIDLRVKDNNTICVDYSEREN